MIVTQDCPLMYLSSEALSPLNSTPSSFDASLFMDTQLGTSEQMFSACTGVKPFYFIYSNKNNNNLFRINCWAAACLTAQICIHTVFLYAYLSAGDSLSSKGSIAVYFLITHSPVLKNSFAVLLGHRKK